MRALARWCYDHRLHRPDPLGWSASGRAPLPKRGDGLPTASRCPEPESADASNC